MIITALASLVMANSIDLSQIAIIGSASFLLIFFIVNIAALKLHKELNANKIIILTSCIISFIALCTLLIHTFFQISKLLLFSLILLFCLYCLKFFTEDLLENIFLTDLIQRSYYEKICVGLLFSEDLKYVV